MNLSEGVIAMLSNGEQGGLEGKPVLQVMDVRLVNGQNPTMNAVERYRMILSDGIHTQQGMLATQRNDLVQSEKLKKGSVIQLTQFVCNLIQNRRIIIIVDLDVILESCDTIGRPTPYPPKLDSNASFVGPPSSAVQQMNQPPRTLPNLAGGTRSEMHGNIGSNAQTSSFAANHDSERHNTTAPMYGRTETGSGISGAPMNSSYSRQPHAVYQQQSPVYMNRGPVSKNEAPSKITPIIALSPYQSSRWTIKARVTSKSELRLFNNQRGDGKVFSFDLLDSGGGEIKVTCFNTVAAQFYDQIESGKVYMISKGTLKPAQKKFNQLNNDYEISLDSNSTIQLCSEDDTSIPKLQFNFRPISDIEGMANKTVIDVIGIVSSISPCSTLTTKNGETQRRNLQLKDMSGCSVELTLWGNFSNVEGQKLQSMCDSGIFPVLAVKSCWVNEYNGKVLGTISSSQLLIEPDFQESDKLKAWFDKDGKNTPSVSLSREMTNMVRPDERKCVAQIKDERLGTSEKPDWITICGTVSFVRRETFCYTACPLRIGDRQCSKKVTNNGDGKWRCERCDQTVDECDYRYVLQLQIQDHSGTAWVTLFQESGEQIMGISAKELYLLKHEAQDDEKFEDIIRNVLFTRYVFKLKVKEETYSDEQRVKSTVMKAEKINFPSETRNLLELMGKMKMEDSGSLPMKLANSKPNTDLNHPGFGGDSKDLLATIPNYGGAASSVVRNSGVHGNQGSSYGSQYGGPVLVSANSPSMYSSCNSCGGTGHTSANCPSITSAQGRPYGGGYGNKTAAPAAFNAGNTSNDCFKCHQPGHFARDCPASNNGPPSANAGNTSEECYKCHQPGHFARDCPASNNGPPSANLGNTSEECYKCHQPGHWARDCPASNNAPRAYGMGNSTTGRYGNVSRQGVGGF